MQSFLLFRPFFVRIEEYDAQTVQASSKDFKVARYVIHPKFNKNRLSNNIAVIILEDPIKLDTQKVTSFNMYVCMYIYVCICSGL